MAIKAGGSSRNGRDTAGRRLGIKFGGEVDPGHIIVASAHQMASGNNVASKINNGFR